MNDQDIYTNVVGEVQGTMHAASVYLQEVPHSPEIQLAKAAVANTLDLVSSRPWSDRASLVGLIREIRTILTPARDHLTTLEAPTAKAAGKAIQRTLDTITDYGNELANR